MLRRILIASGFLLLLIHPHAEETSACRWRGTAPFCLSYCQSGETLAETDRQGDGRACLLGEKALCCQRNLCKWRGSAPFCSGACEAGEVAAVYDRTGPEDGESCITGKKALCCRLGDSADQPDRATQFIVW